MTSPKTSDHLAIGGWSWSRMAICVLESNGCLKDPFLRIQGKQSPDPLRWQRAMTAKRIVTPTFRVSVVAFWVLG